MSNTRLKEIWGVIILAAFALLLGGYSESPYYLLIINKLSDPSLYPNDLLSSAVSGGSLDVSFFFLALTFISKYVDLTIFNFIGYIITLIFFCLAIFYLAKSIFRNNWIAYLAVILLLLPKPGLAGGGTFWTEFIYRDIAIVLAIFAIMYFIKSQYLYSLLLLGLAFNLHIVSALPVLGFFIFDLIFKYRKLAIADKKQMFLSLFLFALIVSPLLIFFSGSSSSLLSSSFFSRADPQWLAIIRERFPHHVSPHTWIDQISVYAPLLILPIVSGIYLLRKKDYLGNLSVHKTLINLLIVFFIYAIIEVIFTEIIPWEPVIVLQLVRLSTFITILGIIYIAYFIYELYTAALNEKVITRVISYLLISGLFVSIFIYSFEFAWAMIPLALTKVIPSNNRKISYPLYFISFALLIYFLVGKLSYVIVLFGLCWFIALMGIDYIKQRHIITFMSRTALLSLTLVAFLIVFIVSLLVTSSLKTGQPLSETIFVRINIPYLTPTSYYKDIQLWAKENTNQSDMFLVPPYAHPGNESIYIQGGFGTYSERPIYGEWQMGGGWGFFSHELAFEWYQRMNDLGIYTEKESRGKYQLLDEAKIRELQQKYNIAYVVFEKPKQLNFKVVYENKLFIVYKIR